MTTENKPSKLRAGTDLFFNIVDMVLIAFILAVDTSIVVTSGTKSLSFIILNVFLGYKLMSFISGQYTKRWQNLATKIVGESAEMIKKERDKFDNFSKIYQEYRTISERDIGNLQAEVDRLHGILGPNANVTTGKTNV